MARACSYDFDVLAGQDLLFRIQDETKELMSAKCCITELYYHVSDYRATTSWGRR